MKIPYQKYHFIIQAEDRLTLPEYKGSTFRGGFGNAFRRVVCALKKKECTECLLKTKCIYAYIFETQPPTLPPEKEATTYNKGGFDSMYKYLRIPHPFIIEPPMAPQRVYEAGEELSFKLILIGKAVEYLPYFIFTFDELGKIGIGKGRGKYVLKKVEAGQITIYSSEDKIILPSVPANILIPEELSFDLKETNSDDMITLNFLTPARIIHQRKLTSDLEFHILITSLLRRIAQLSWFHCEGQLPSWDYKHIIHEAAAIAIFRNSLRWWDWERYSARQDRRMKMGGVIGEVTYRGNIKIFLPILKAGEIFHAGKGTSFGLGKYEMKQGKA